MAGKSKFPSPTPTLNPPLTVTYNGRKWPEMAGESKFPSPTPALRPPPTVTYNGRKWPGNRNFRTHLPPAGRPPQDCPRSIPGPGRPRHRRSRAHPPSLARKPILSRRTRPPNSERYRQADAWLTLSRARSYNSVNPACLASSLPQGGGAPGLTTQCLWARRGARLSRAERVAGCHRPLRT